MRSLEVAKRVFNMLEVNGRNLLSPILDSHPNRDDWSYGVEQILVLCPRLSYLRYPSTSLSAIDDICRAGLHVRSNSVLPYMSLLHIEIIFLTIETHAIGLLERVLLLYSFLLDDQLNKPSKSRRWRRCRHFGFKRTNEDRRTMTPGGPSVAKVCLPILVPYGHHSHNVICRYIRRPCSLERGLLANL